MLSQKRTILALTEQKEYQAALGNLQSKNNNRLTVKVIERFSTDQTLIEQLRSVDLILIDFNSRFDPLLDTLKSLKAQELLRVIPVVGICKNFSNEHVEQLYGAHINALIDLAKQTQHFHQVLDQIVAYWLDMIIHPQNSWEI